MRYAKWLVPIILIAALALVFTISVAGAPPTQSGVTMAPPYSIPWNVLSGGGGVMHSDSYILMGTVGQPAIGNVTSASYIMQTGYWAGAWPWRHMLLPVMEK